MSEVFEKARELGEAILDCNEYKALKRAEIEENNDEEAMRLIADYSELRASLASEAQNGNISEERLTEIQQEMDEAYERLTTNDRITAYINAEKDFKAVIDQMNAILSYHITGKLPGGCSGSCSSCNGCH